MFYGEVPGASMARRPLDNEGVQYGLAAFNAGVIDIDPVHRIESGYWWFRSGYEIMRLRDIVLTSKQPGVLLNQGRILFGGAGLASTPIIDYRRYMDHQENGDIHMIVHQFSTRQRLMRANGHADNQILQIGRAVGFTMPKRRIWASLFRQMDQWLMAIQSDSSPLAASEKSDSE